MGNPRRSYEKTGPMPFATVAKTALLAPPTTGDCLVVGSVEVGNGSASAMRLGWGWQLPNSEWKAGQWDNSATGAEYLDDTTDAQDAGADDFKLADKDNANDGYVVAARHKFNIIGVTLGVAGGTAGTVEYAYSTAAGWTVFTPITTFAANMSPGDGYIMFLTPPLWAKTIAGTTHSGIGAGFYAIRVRYTTAPTTTSPLATVLWVNKLVDYVESCDAGKSILWDSGTEQRIPAKASLIAYAATADAENWINVEYTTSG